MAKPITNAELAKVDENLADPEPCLYPASQVAALRERLRLAEAVVETASRIDAETKRQQQHARASQAVIDNNKVLRTYRAAVAKSNES